MRGPTESSQAADSDAACTVGLLRTVSGAVSSDATAIHGIAPAGTVQNTIREHESAPVRTAQDSSTFRPILPENSKENRILAEMSLAAPRLPSHEKLPTRELRRPISPDISSGFGAGEADYSTGRP